jgi:hypothetical protein
MVSLVILLYSFFFVDTLSQATRRGTKNKTTAWRKAEPQNDDDVEMKEQAIDEANSKELKAKKGRVGKGKQANTKSSTTKRKRESKNTNTATTKKRGKKSNSRSKVSTENEQKEQLRAAFEVFDVDGSGNIFFPLMFVFLRNNNIYL